MSQRTRAQSTRLWLAGTALALLIPLGLVAAYIWQAGLDLQSPASARQWIRVCARSRIDTYCEAAARVTREVDGPLVFLHPNMGDSQIAAALSAWQGRGPSAQEPDAVARANLFPVASLNPGIVTSLDGQERQVVCGLPNERRACRIDHLRFRPQNQPRSAGDGAVYSVFDSRHSEPRGLPLFLPPR